MWLEGLVWYLGKRLPDGRGFRTGVRSHPGQVRFEDVVCLTWVRVSTG